MFGWVAVAASAQAYAEEKAKEGADTPPIEGEYTVVDVKELPETKRLDHADN